MTERLHSNQKGFALIEIILVVLVLAAITGLAIWRLGGKKDEQAQNKQTIMSGSLTAEDRNKLEEAQQKELATQPASTTTNTATTPTSTTPNTSQSKTNTKTTSPASTTPTQTTPTPAPATSAPATASGTRPTAAFCQEKNGSSFAAWATQNKSHTYQVYENGGWVSKTETGTAGHNSDTMKVVGVIPHLNQAAWAICAEQANYVVYYYKPTGSIYTYNWLVSFDAVSVTKP